MFKTPLGLVKFFIKKLVGRSQLGIRTKFLWGILTGAPWLYGPN